QEYGRVCGSACLETARAFSRLLLQDSDRILRAISCAEPGPVLKMRGHIGQEDAAFSKHFVRPIHLRTSVLASCMANASIEINRDFHWIVLPSFRLISADPISIGPENPSEKIGCISHL